LRVIREFDEGLRGTSVGQRVIGAGARALDRSVLGNDARMVRAYTKKGTEKEFSAKITREPYAMARDFSGALGLFGITLRPLCERQT